MQESSQTRIYTQMQAKPETQWDRHRMLSVCPHGAKSREDNEEQTQLSLVNVCMRVRCCVNALHFLNLPEGGGGREDNSALIKPL